ncbi:hypothetical protein JAAARDRAFT_63487 [Jaapia argillacea MUCL 33604]|uniref:Uncharacterized protein n=1 Tax=Jaapia argillacea MUCL 33604 TaxID=933084 RepID=A0A067PFT2_9AGAM|nr:hypothetical protein JAAARDRAFT_63487 [Jaapia argillacea MUCL 33604]
MAALMWAARDAVKYAETHSEVKHLHFFADNSAAVRAIFEPKLRRGQSFAIPFQEAITGFLDSDGTHTFGIAWTPGHQDIPDVERADALDKDAEWRREWKLHPHQGRYAAANRFPPSWKPPQHFEWLLREVYGRATQCRVGHAFIGEECPRFNEYRHILRDVSEQISLPVILGIRKGIDALASFIDESGAFTRENLRRRNSNSHNSMNTVDPKQ